MIGDLADADALLDAGTRGLQEANAGCAAPAADDHSAAARTSAGNSIPLDPANPLALLARARESLDAIRVLHPLPYTRQY